MRLPSSSSPLIVVALAFSLALTVAQENKLRTTLDGVTFDSDYDNGSLGSIALRAPGEFQASLFTEDGELGERRYWFRFRMSGIAGRKLHLTLDHARNPRPFLRLGDGPWRRMTSEEAPDINTLSLNFGNDETLAEVAFFEPLGLAETHLAVQALVDRWPGVATRQVLGQSEEGRDVWEIMVTDPDGPNAQKRRVWLHSRAHAGEVTSSHSMLGFLEQMLEDSSLGRRLRERLIVHVVPILNVDGTAQGLTRWDGEGRDPESEWCAIRSQPVQLIKDRVDALMASDHPIEVALNLHSTQGEYADTFFFKHVAPSVTPAFEAIQQRYIDAFDAATPLFENRSPGTSQLAECRFIESYFWNGWGEDVMALTHEGHYYRRVTDRAWITGSDYRELGRKMAEALIGYFGIDAPDPGLTYHSWKDRHFSAFEQALSGLSEPEEDPDRDGRSNLEEYAYGSDPRERDREPLPWEIQRDGLNVRRSPAPSDLTWHVERSDDLASWETAGLPILTAERLRFATQPEGFYRFIVRLGEQP